MKKKIAILTQPLGMNYGGILQNYALQKILEKMGHDPITINRWTNHNVSPLRVALYYFKIENTVYRKTFNFLKKHVALTGKIDSDQKIITHFRDFKYDAVIVGSDQTWRPKMSPNIYNYFLDFLQGKDSSNIKKIAYATSFGTSDWEFTVEQTNKIKVLIKQFDSISVRENTGVDLCKEFLGTDVQHVLDPTMLLSSNDYDQIFANKKYPDNKGIFAYVLDRNNENDLIINKISSYFKKDIFRNQAQYSISKKQKSKKYPALETWVKSFSDADFIITDSFHGTVFSILYKKPFVTIVNKNRGAARFYSLLEPLGLQMRLVESEDHVTSVLLNQIIDFKSVSDKLEILKENSLSFLQKSLT